ncbi:hypothetical protein KCP77_24615 [Salmonella enterica subsp. enterica]|nr:hypothetical protein KCP77_24615 [Salmonella enterica subsp. enterica]
MLSVTLERKPFVAISPCTGLRRQNHYQDSWGRDPKASCREDAFSAGKAHREENSDCETCRRNGPVNGIHCLLIPVQLTLFCESNYTSAFPLITNSALIADKIKEHSLQARVYVLGGEYDYHFAPTSASRFVSRLTRYAVPLFIGAGGISPQHGVLVKSFEEASLPTMIAMSKISDSCRPRKFGGTV